MNRSVLASPNTWSVSLLTKFMDIALQTYRRQDPAARARLTVPLRLIAFP